MSLFECIAPDLVVHILSEWICWKDLPQLDIAVCNRNLRDKYIKVLQIQNVNLRVVLGRTCNWNVYRFLVWVRNRHMRLSKWKSCWSNYHALMQSSSCNISVASLESLNISGDHSSTGSIDTSLGLLQTSQLPRLQELVLSMNDHDVSIANILPLLCQLSSLSLHVNSLPMQEVELLSRNLHNIRVLNIQISFGSSAGIIQTLFFEHHLPLLESFSLTSLGPDLFSHSPFSSPVTDDGANTLSSEQVKKLPNLKRLYVDMNSLLTIAPLAPNITHINPLSFHKFSPYKAGFLQTLVGYCPRLVQLSLELQFIPVALSAEAAQALATVVIPTCTHLTSLSLCFGYDLMQYIWPVLTSISAQLHHLQRIYFTYYKAKLASHSNPLMAPVRTHISSSETYSRWIRFWVVLFESNQQLSHVEVRSLPFSVTEIASVAPQLQTLVLKHITFGSPAPQQSAILHALASFPKFRVLSRFEIQDDHITDQIAQDMLHSIASQCLVEHDPHHHPSRCSSLQKLTLLSHSLTNQTLQTWLYLPDEFTQILYCVTLCAEYSVSLEPLLERFAQRYCLPSGSVRKLHVVVDMDDSIRRQVIPVLNKRLYEKQREYASHQRNGHGELSTESVVAGTRFASPVVQDWREKKHSIALMR